MNRPDIPVYSKGRIAIGLAIAFGAALISPLLCGFATVVMVFTVLNAFLYSFSGMIPAAVAMLLDVAAFGLYFGMPGAAAAAMGFVLPSAYIIRNLRFRLPFFRQVTHAVVAQVIGILAALVVLRMFVGADLIGALVGILRSGIEILPAGFIDYFIDMFYSIEEIPAMLTESQLIDGVLDAERRANYLDGMMTEISANLRLTTPGALLSSAYLTGIMSVGFAGKMLNHISPAEGAFVNMRRWVTPWQVSIGLTAMQLIAILLALMGVNGADVLQVTMQQLLLIVCLVQASISIERRFTQLNMRPAPRILINIGIQLLVPTTLVMFYGTFSALFGSTGAMVQLRARRMKNNDNNDNNDIN